MSETPASPPLAITRSEVAVELRRLAMGYRPRTHETDPNSNRRAFRIPDYERIYRWRVDEGGWPTRD